MSAEDDGPHVCIDMELPLQLMLDSAERAVMENPQNASSGEISVSRRLGLDPVLAERFGALLTGKRWKNGRQLRVRHLDGDAAIHEKVESFARIWEKYANLTFDFGDHAEAEIRISYHLDNQSWSYIGTDALSVMEPEHTMHFGWLRPKTDDREVRRVVVHEFGHALGLIHEHQHPEYSIKWDRQAVYNHYCDRLKWTKEQVDRNLFAPHLRGETQFSKYDPDSIMHYPVPPELTVDRHAVGRNWELSETDKLFIAQMYQKPVPAGVMSESPPDDIAASDAEVIMRRWG